MEAHSILMIMPMGISMTMDTILMIIVMTLRVQGKYFNLYYNAGVI